MRTTQSPFSRSALLALPSLLALGAAPFGCSADAGGAHEPESRSSSSALATEIDISQNSLSLSISTLLSGSRLQLSNTGEGTPLPGNGAPPGTGAMSYFQVGDQLKQQSPGLADKALDIPPKVEDLGAKVVAAEFFGQGTLGSFLIDQIRIDLNDLNVNLNSTDITITTDTNGITAAVQMTSAQPSLKCYGNTWLPVLFIPIGWQDDTCPDMELSNIVVTARFMPTVDASSNIAISQATVTFDADIDGGTVGNGLGVFYDYRTKLKADFSSKFSEYLTTPQFEAAVAAALTSLVDAAAGPDAGGTKFARVTVDANGLHAFPGTFCAPKTCATVGAGACGTLSDGCGGTLDCGGCPAGESCGASGAPNLCGCAPIVCAAGACGSFSDACGDTVSCGGCAAGLTCQSHRCSTCQPVCAGKKCGATNGCGGTCIGYCQTKFECETDPDTGAHFCGYAGP